ncbi:hypothetical protein SLEP1_g19478 [Rubroshorea leprosula]|uniref:Uncharacterized protein n=1 Tax=Rubroshorea leprosula TaxID=152421 RepID=A0AAV5IZH0_9ROSI|nr:hypothetical protein SLEP1_g19478 [Rubroshorea leprosula]
MSLAVHVLNVDVNMFSAMDHKFHILSLGFKDDWSRFSTTAMHKEGKLVPLLTEAGAVANTSAEAGVVA